MKHIKRNMYLRFKMRQINHVFISSNNLLYINDKFKNILHILDKNIIIQYRKTITEEYYIFETNDGKEFIISGVYINSYLNDNELKSLFI